MLATMLVAVLVASAYAFLIAGHLAAARRDAPATDANRPRIAVWLAACGERRRARPASGAAYRLVTGPIRCCDGTDR